MRILLKLTITDDKLAKLKISNICFRNLQRDAKSILFTFVNLFDGNVNIIDDEKKSTPIEMTFEKKNDVDRSTLYVLTVLFNFYMLT